MYTLNINKMKNVIVKAVKDKATGNEYIKECMRKFLHAKFIKDKEYAFYQFLQQKLAEHNITNAMFVAKKEKLPIPTACTYMPIIENKNYTSKKVDDPNAYNNAIICRVEPRPYDVQWDFIHKGSNFILTVYIDTNRMIAVNDSLRYVMSLILNQKEYCYSRYLYMPLTDILAVDFYKQWLLQAQAYARKL